MTFLERIRELCRRDGITVARAEKDLGFSNAYLSQLNILFFPIIPLFPVFFLISCEHSCEHVLPCTKKAAPAVGAAEAYR